MRLLLSIALITLSTFSSCKKDSDEEIPAKVDPRLKFLGTWKCKETVLNQQGERNYNSDVKISSNNLTDIIISNPYNLGSSTNLIAQVNNDSLIFEVILDNFFLSGKGYFINNSFTLNYKASQNISKIDTVTAKYTK